jgi:hypothetical protein
MMDDLLPCGLIPESVNDNDVLPFFDELLEDSSPTERMLIRRFGVKYLGGRRFAKMWCPEVELLAEILGEDF